MPRRARPGRYSEDNASINTPKVDDTYQFKFGIRSRKLSDPWSDQELRHLLRTQIARDEVTITVEAISKVKKDVCRLYI